MAEQPQVLDPRKVVESLIEERSGRVDNKRLAECLLDQFKGVEGLAQEFYVEYVAQPSGSVSKSRLLTAALALINAVSHEQGDQDVAKDMTNEELAAAIRVIASGDKEDEE